MKRSRTLSTSLPRRVVPCCFAILLLALSVHSEGNDFSLQADPIAVDTLPDSEVTVRIERSEESLDQEVVVTLESLAPEIATVPEAVVIPAGERGIDVRVLASSPGGANIRAYAERFGQVMFTVNVFDELDRVLQTVSPERIDLTLGSGQSATRAVSLSVSAEALPSNVDIVFAVDARPTFAQPTTRLANAASEIDRRLKAAFPSVSFGYSVAKFQDFGGPGKIFKRLEGLSPDSELTRPFILLLPNVLASDPANVTALRDALATQLPGFRDTSNMATWLEALQQIALGTGFDANANGSNLDSGLAGVRRGPTIAFPLSTQGTGYLDPGTSGDVPPFSSKPASISTAGSQGGVGFRAGSLRIIVLATNTYTVAPLPRGATFPNTVTGVAGTSAGMQVFQEVNTFSREGLSPGTFQNPRFGPVSASVSVADPINAVAPKGAALIQEVFTGLAAQNIKVISFYQISEDSPFGNTLVDPTPMLQSVARLTAATDKNVPLVFELLGANAAGVADQIVAAVTPPITAERAVSLRAVGNDEGFGFTYTPPSVVVAPGGSAAFTVTITGTGSSGAFEIQFVTDDGVVLGRIPVTITAPGEALPPTITGINPDRGRIGTAVTITGTNFTSTLSDLRVTFGGISSFISSATTTTINTTVPAGSVAGPVNVVVTVGTLASNTFPFTVLHTINSLSPTSGLAGIPFTITGSAFASGVTGNTVVFGSTVATITEATNTVVRGIVPPSLTPGPYLVRITTNTVTTDVGTFTVLSPTATISSIVPNRGPGNTAFTITGTGFSTTAGDNTITFTDQRTGVATRVTVTSATATTLGGRVPVALVAGVYNVTVAVGGTAATGTLTFTVEPFITGVTPSPAVIGGQLRISGTGFSSTLSENVVTLNGRTVSLDAGSTASTLLVTVARGTSGASIAVQVTTRGVPSNVVTVPLSQAPVMFATCVRAEFERRDRIVVTVCGSDATGDVVSASMVFRDGEGLLLGRFDAIDVRTMLAGRFDFEFKVPFTEANHFTAAMTVEVQLKDAAGNSSNTITAKVFNPDVRP